MKKQKPKRTGSSNARSKQQRKQTTGLNSDGHIAPKITQSEAEVMFIIKHSTSIETNDIPPLLLECFRKQRSRNRISEIISNIEKKQVKYDRTYIKRSTDYPSTFSIDADSSVDKRITATMLLELRTTSIFGSGDEPTLDAFKGYLTKTYQDMLTELDHRITICEQLGYVSIVDVEIPDGTYVQQIKEADRLRHDLEYLVLLTRDHLTATNKKYEDLQKEKEDLCQQVSLEKNEKRLHDLIERKKLVCSELKPVANLLEHLTKLILAVKPNLRSQNLIISDFGGTQ